MARISIAIEPLHSDGTVCEHPTDPSGRPRNPQSSCTGHRSYRVQCSACGPVGTPHGLRTLAQPEQTRHRDSHKTASTGRRPAPSTRPARREQRRRTGLAPSPAPES